MIDVGALLRRRASDRVSVSLPPTRAAGRRVADELYAAAANALDNAAVARRARRPGLRAARGSRDSMTVSIRDDGVGIADGRLEEAVAKVEWVWRNRLWDG